MGEVNSPVADRRGGLASLVVGAMVLLSASATAEPLPVLGGETLAGLEMTIPGDLPALGSVFVIGFSSASRRQTEVWSRQLRELLPADEVTLFSVSVVEGVPRPLRGFVRRQIRSSVPGELHDRFLMVTEGSADWQRLCTDSKADTACVVAASPQRQIVWRAHGPVSDSALQELLATLQRVAADKLATACCSR